MRPVGSDVSHAPSFGLCSAKPTAMASLSRGSRPRSNEPSLLASQHHFAGTAKQCGNKPGLAS
jgi:hypothetical protein